MNHRALLALLLLYTASGLQAEEPPTATETVFPEQLGAQDLLSRCNASALTGLGRERRRYCAGFLSGIEEAVHLLQAAGDAASRAVCMPAGTSDSQLAGIYSRFAGQNPSLMELPAAEVALRALQNTFPCPGAAGS